MPIADNIIRKVAEDIGVSVDELTVSGLLALLREKRRKMMLDRLEVLARYGATSVEELEKKIEDGTVVEHPAWENLIVLENLEAAIAIIDEDIKTIKHFTTE